MWSISLYCGPPGLGEYSPTSSSTVVSGFLPKDARNQYLLSRSPRQFLRWLPPQRHTSWFSDWLRPNQLFHQKPPVCSQQPNHRQNIYTQGNKLTIAPPLGVVHTNPIGIIPKPHQPGKFHLIVDLSAPNGHSVNDSIPSDICSIQYASVKFLFPIRPFTIALFFFVCLFYLHGGLYTV